MRSERTVAEMDEKYYRQLVDELEVLIGEQEDTDTPGAYERTKQMKEQLGDCYARLALACYAQGKLHESIEAAKQATPAWASQFLPRLNGVSDAILKIDQTDCDCKPEEPLHRKFSVELYESIFLLHCVDCGAFHARSRLPESLQRKEVVV